LYETLILINSDNGHFHFLAVDCTTIMLKTRFSYLSERKRSTSLVVLLAWCCLSQIVVVAGENTKLVIFAGPHKAASTSVESFFYEYASGHSRTDADGHKKDNHERKKTFGLRYWLWPRVYGHVANETEPLEPYKIFGHLVTEPENDALEQEILEDIREAWNTKGLEGVIIGSELFDQIGEQAPYDAMKALRKVVAYLNVKPNDVTVALNYRTPRVEHWASMWSHASKNVNYTKEYEDWMCDEELVPKHVEILATQMNPLNAAEAFVKEGWNVRLIDMEGVESSGRDVSHVVACDVVAARCADGAVLNHLNDNPHKNAVDAEFSALNEEQRNDTEQLFRSLDCAYEDFLRTNVKFGIIYNETVWQDCDPELADVYKRLKDEPSTMYKALLSQVQCPAQRPIGAKNMVDMNEALTGEIPESAHKSKSKSEHKKRSAGGIFLEFLIFVGCTMAAMGYQYHRMTTNSSSSSSVPAGAHRIETAVEDSEEGEFSNTAAEVDAEYGDADDGFEDELPSGYKD
jgi:hypothetical protein